MKNVPFPRLNAPALGVVLSDSPPTKHLENFLKNMALAKNQDRINAGTPLTFGAARSNLQPLARGGDAVTPSLILMRKTDAVRADDLPNAEWNDMGEVKVMGKEGVCALFAATATEDFEKESPMETQKFYLL